MRHTSPISKRLSDHSERFCCYESKQKQTSGKCDAAATQFAAAAAIAAAAAAFTEQWEGMNIPQMQREHHMRLLQGGLRCYWIASARAATGAAAATAAPAITTQNATAALSREFAAAACGKQQLDVGGSRYLGACSPTVEGPFVSDKNDPR